MYACEARNSLGATISDISAVILDVVNGMLYCDPEI